METIIKNSLLECLSSYNTITELQEELKKLKSNLTDDIDKDELYKQNQVIQEIVACMSLFFDSLYLEKEIQSHTADVKQLNTPNSHQVSSEQSLKILEPHLDFLKFLTDNFKTSHKNSSFSEEAKFISEKFNEKISENNKFLKENLEKIEDSSERITKYDQILRENRDVLISLKKNLDEVSKIELENYFAKVDFPEPETISINVPDTPKNIDDFVDEDLSTFIDELNQLRIRLSKQLSDLEISVQNLEREVSFKERNTTISYDNADIFPVSSKISQQFYENSEIFSKKFLEFSEKIKIFNKKIENAKKIISSRNIESKVESPVKVSEKSCDFEPLYAEFQESTMRNINQKIDNYKLLTSAVIKTEHELSAEKISSAYKNLILCKRCKANAIKVVCVPCGHVMCKACATSMVENKIKKCEECKAKIVSMIDIAENIDYNTF